MDFIFIIIILVMSVVIHEVSHGYAALALGDPTAKYQNRLTLNPFSHLDPVGSFIVPLIGYMLGGFVIGWAKPVPFNPYNLKPERWGIPTRFGEAIVAIAGPLSNIALAVIFGLIIRFGYLNNIISTSFLELSVFVVSINITLAIFNLVPIPPLDGSKVLFSFLPYSLSSLRFALERYGLVFIIIFIALFSQILVPLVKYSFVFLTGIPL